MINQEDIIIVKWNEESRKMLEKASNVLEEIGAKNIDLPDSIYENDKPVSMVFTGQYSAGKSTIIKALTGISSIATGEKITTEDSQEYEWNEIKVVDTPGIHTTLRPDHDDITYRAILDSDMLVYVITPELFDSYIGNQFKTLLIEKNKANEMILIVNKMANAGNTPETQAIKLKNLKLVTEPYSPEDLRTCFIDAESYLDSLTEDDQEIAEELRKRSNYIELVSTINDFVKEKSFSSKLTTVLHKIDNALLEAMHQFEPSSEDGDVESYIQFLLQKKRMQVSISNRISHHVKSIYREAAFEIRDKGRYIANTLYDYSSENEANREIEKAYHDVETISSTCTDSIVAEVEKLSIEFEAELETFYNSDFSKKLEFRLNEKYQEGNPFVKRIFNSDIFAEGSNKIVSSTVGDHTVTGMRSFSGSNAHNLVLKIGHKLGHKFKPWEAVNMAKKINVAGKALGVFGVVFSLGMQVKEDIDEENRRQEMRSNRDKLRAGFNEAANELEKHFHKAISELLNENYYLPISEIDKQISEIRMQHQVNSENLMLIEKIRLECKALIRLIQDEV